MLAPSKYGNFLWNKVEKSRRWCCTNIGVTKSRKRKGAIQWSASRGAVMLEHDLTTTGNT